jgi:putative spermidine/putrescine transport system permease protein
LIKEKHVETIKQALSYGYMAVISGILLLPFIVTLLRSLTVSLPDGGTSYGVRPYFEIIGAFWPKVYTSLSISITTIIIDAIVGIPAAYALVRYNFRGKRTLFTMLNGVWYVPGIAYAMSLILAYYFIYRMFLGYWGFVAAYSAGFLLLMLMTCVVAFKYLDVCYEESASCLGAGRLTTFFRVTLPLIGPGVSAGIMLIFVLAFNELITALLLNAPTRIMTAPVRVFSDVRNYGVREFIAAEAVILQLISLGVVAVYLKIVGSKYLRGVILV